jgi:hypothetical protein
MDVRLVQLLASFIGARNRYVLARLEFAMFHADVVAPPLIERLSDASERTLLTEWPAVERELNAALSHGAGLALSNGKDLADDRTYRALERSLRELDQYARAITWVMTVSQREGN